MTQQSLSWNQNKHSTVSSASFRDPSGFVFERDGVLYRQVNHYGRGDYECLLQSGLYDRLTQKGLLVEHGEVDIPGFHPESAFKILRPECVDFISYPYEWSFSQLKDAALVTLDIQAIALEMGMNLKDASAYNIQFHRGRPVMIDTLSFEAYVQGRPWPAYRQFCQHFLAPLAVMAKTDVRLNSLLAAFIDGLPLDLASNLLPRKTWLQPGLTAHLHIHARTQKAYSTTSQDQSKGKRKPRSVSLAGLTGIIQGLRKAVHKLDLLPEKTEWRDYYSDINYTEQGFEAKKQLIREYLHRIGPNRVWDLGANTGVFSRIPAQMGIFTVAWDMDPLAVDLHYQHIKESGSKNILPLQLDLTNPSPGLGWAGIERDSLGQRGPVDCILALALIHHLAISNNVPFEKIASYLAGLCTFLIIEFVPKEDSQVQRLLAFRDDIFRAYEQARFEADFASCFWICDQKAIPGSKRTLYLMERKGPEREISGRSACTLDTEGKES